MIAGLPEVSTPHIKFPFTLSPVKENKTRRNAKELRLAQFYHGFMPLIITQVAVLEERNKDINVDATEIRVVCFSSL